MNWRAALAEWAKSLGVDSRGHELAILRNLYVHYTGKPDGGLNEVQCLRGISESMGLYIRPTHELGYLRAIFGGDSSGLNEVGLTLGIARGSALGSRIVLASSVASRDSNKVTGGGTDSTVALQAVLDTGDDAASPLVLVIDGDGTGAGYLVSGLIQYPHTTIRGLNDGGLFQKAGSNKPIIQNQKRLTRAGAWDAGIVVEGTSDTDMLWINGNSANQTQVETGMGAYGTFVVTVWLGHCNAPVLRDVHFYECKTFSALINDYTGGMTAENIHRTETTATSYQDIVHVWGPCVGESNISVTGTNTGDDTIGFNIDELVAVGRPLAPHESEGEAIYPIHLSTHGNNCNQGIRLLSIYARLEQPHIISLTGQFGISALSIGYAFPGYGPGNIGHVTVDSLSFALKTGSINWHGAPVNDNALDTPRWNVIGVNGAVDSLTITAATITPGDERPQFFCGTNTTIGELSLPANLVNDDAFAFVAYARNSATVGTVAITDSHVFDGDEGILLGGLSFTGTSFTLTGWASSATAAVQSIASQWGYLTGAPVEHYSWVAYLNSDGSMNMLVKGSGGVVNIGTAAGSFPLDNTQHFFAVRVNETANTAEVKVDGGSWVSGSIGTGIIPSNSALCIGLHYAQPAPPLSAATTEFNGTLQDLRITNSALSDVAVEAIRTGFLWLLASNVWNDAARWNDSAVWPS